MTSMEKAFLGAMAGLAAVVVKFLGQDYANMVAHAADLTANQLLSYKIGYGILTPMLMFLGAFIAWVTEERKRIKIVAMAVAAPAMITTWSGGQKASSLALMDPLVRSAYAQPAAPANDVRIANPDAVTEQSTLQKIQSGVSVFFGYGNKEPRKYWVIVGSYKDRNAAQALADKLNQADPSLNAFVGLRLPGNDYYPVIVGDYSYLSEARQLKRKALETKFVREAYFSTGERR